MNRGAIINRPLKRTTTGRRFVQVNLCNSLPGSLSEQCSTRATVTSPPGVQGYAGLAAHIHRAGEEMHDGIATAKNRDSYADI
jgi:hypothetical protein